MLKTMANNFDDLNPTLQTLMCKLWNKSYGNFFVQKMSKSVENK